MIKGLVECPVTICWGGSRKPPLYKLGQLRQGEAHLRASWLFTRADIVVNIGVICSGILVAFTNSRYPDLVVGFFVSLYVIKEAIGIIKES